MPWKPTFRFARGSGLLMILVLVCQRPAPGAEGDEEFFEKRVRPVLISRCYECHSGDATEGDLRVDSRLHLLEGGSRGPALVPGKPEQSLMVFAINHADQLHMPPKQKLPLREIADLTDWIQRGAYWPETSTTPAPSVPGKPQGPRPLTAEERSYWAFQRPSRVPPPETGDPAWLHNPIDAFVLRRLEDESLRHAGRAERLALIRRLTFNLTGLSPTPEEVMAFVGDGAPDAIERLVDRLLASPHYGVRWGRRWLDVVRYADSNGLDENLAYANAFRYRDYVVDAFNRDKPYDRFVQEQVAGDLLVPEPVASANAESEALAAWQQAVTATGFLSVGAKMLAEDDPVKMQMDIIDEQIDTIGQALLGMTFGCARCHDHKFDPFRMEDYYALAGIFQSTKTMENFSVVARWQERVIGSPAERARQEQLTAEIARRRKEEQEQLDAAANELIRQARRRVDAYLLAAATEQTLAQYLSQASPLGADPTQLAASRAIVWEAEDFSRGNVQRNTDTYGKGIGVLVNQGPTPNFVEYDLEIPAAGAYRLEARYAALAARPCSLHVGGQVAPFRVATKTTGGWNPESQAWHVEGIVRLPVGRVVVRLEHPQAFPHLDKLLLAPLADSPELAAFMISDTGSEPLVPEFREQWTKRLTATDQASDSPFSVWQSLRSGTLRWDSDQPLVAEFMRRAGARPDSLVTLARQLGKLSLEAVEAWEARGAAESGTPPSELADPLLESLRRVIYAADGPFARPKSIEPYLPDQVRVALQGAREETKQLEAALPKLPEAMAVSEGAVTNARVHFRGSHFTLGAEVPRGFPRVIVSPVAAPQSQSGRLELAHWLTEQNPLTARVMVNRVWAGHLGHGLVRSADNFGQLGERPSHPELLDWLATEFERDWSIKRLNRWISLSAVAQMATPYDPVAVERDPDNRLLWRANRRRLEAEEVRDALIQVGEGLDPTCGGSLLPTPNRQYVTSTANVNPVVYDSRRRSIFLPVVRSAVYEVLQAFDFPDPAALHGTRESTTVASQALFMLNSPLVATQLRALAERLISSAETPASRIERAFRTVLGRAPSPPEQQRFEQLLADLDTAFRASVPDDSERLRRCWQNACRTLLASNEFLYLD